jgi:hypothetical protein
MMKGKIQARRWLVGLGLLPLLMGCTYTRGEPAATTDSVLAAQYRASGVHGAMTGSESQKVTDSYQQQIGTANAPPRADAADTADISGAQAATSAPTPGSALGQ